MGDRCRRNDRTILRCALVTGFGLSQSVNAAETGAVMVGEGESKEVDEKEESESVILTVPNANEKASATLTVANASESANESKIGVAEATVMEMAGGCGLSGQGRGSIVETVWRRIAAPSQTHSAVSGTTGAP